MTSYSVNDLIREVLQSMDTTVKAVKEKEKEMEKLKEEYDNLAQYDTAFTYTDGFWDGFWYGACLMTSLMGGIMYCLR